MNIVTYKGIKYNKESILLFVCLVQWKLETMRKRLAATTSIDTAPRNVQIAG